ncbi:MAG: SPFH domain-containing protein [Steroidobacteraceae bacterium]
MKRIVASPSQEREVSTIGGGLMLVVLAVALVASVVLWIKGIVSVHAGAGNPAWFIFGLLLFLVVILSLFGFYTLEPNQARVLVLFGSYKGTVRTAGFHWGNPFYANGSPSGKGASAPPQRAKGDLNLHFPRRSGNRMKISLRARNLNGDRLKVNDKRGNPIEIAAVLVWRVDDTAQAVFDVDDYEEYVRVQSESALRHLTSQYAYDNGEDDEVTLRSGVDEVSEALTRELAQRLAKAGVEVEEARLTHLAYAPEIAQAMLRRQQAEAVIAARKKIVLGAVSMVESAIKDLAAGGVVELDPERRASMVSNLMVVLCSDSQTQPVINTGTLYG